MNYWYLKEGDIVGPMTAEEIAKDISFAKDSLVCPQDKAEQAEFWKPASSYAEDFASFITQDSEAELEIPTEVFLDDISLDEEEETSPEAQSKNTSAEPKEDKAELEKKENAAVIEDKNPFESDRPQIAPDLEETISSHGVAPRLDADGDTLLEDIPAKAILGQQEEKEDILQDKDFIASSSLASEDTLEDTPILNIFERTQERNNTKELQDISDNIYDTYGKDKEKEQSIKIKALPASNPEREELVKKNNRIYLLFIAMFVLVIVALFIAAFDSGSEKTEEAANKAALPIIEEQQNPQGSLKESSAEQPLTTEESPVVDTSALLNTLQNNALEKDRALQKVKGYILPGGKTIETFLTQKYTAYQTSWEADILSGKNYFVHFKASKIRQEPLVYSFSIDLDKNEINGLNNLGIDLLMKGE